jgi:hypothetical protein
MWYLAHRVKRESLERNESFNYSVTSSLCSSWGNDKVNTKKSWVWWDTPVISVLRSLRQEDHKFEASLGNIARRCLKKPRRKRKENINTKKKKQHCGHKHCSLGT